MAAIRIVFDWSVYLLCGLTLVQCGLDERLPNIGHTEYDSSINSETGAPNTLHTQPIARRLNENRPLSYPKTPTTRPLLSYAQNNTKHGLATNLPTTCDNNTLFQAPNSDSNAHNINDIADAAGQDRDGDHVPNDADLWPDNANLPGTIEAGVIYMHTATKLFYLEIDSNHAAPVEVGSFSFSNASPFEPITDIAIDRFGVIYAISFASLFTCHPDTALCSRLSSLPGSYNGLTFVSSQNDPRDRERLIGISASGSWYEINFDSAPVTTNHTGSYGVTYYSSGDSFSSFCLGTYAAVYKSGVSTDYLVQVNPQSGSIIREVGPLGTFSSVFGLAGSSKALFAFDSTGAIIKVNPETGLTEIVAETSWSWWGAGGRIKK